MCATSGRTIGEHESALEEHMVVRWMTPQAETKMMQEVQLLNGLLVVVLLAAAQWHHRVG
jgi:hypothetical protein